MHLYSENKSITLETVQLQGGFACYVSGRGDRLTYRADVPDTADLGYPATTELADGSLYTVWYQHSALGEPAIIYGAHWTF